MTRPQTTRAEETYINNIAELIDFICNSNPEVLRLEELMRVNNKAMETHHDEYILLKATLVRDYLDIQQGVKNEEARH